MVGYYPTDGGLGDRCARDSYPTRESLVRSVSLSQALLDV